MTEKIRSCPSCGSQMKTFFKGNVVIDVCPKCSGSFYDFKELKEALTVTEVSKNVSDKIVRWDDVADHAGKTLTCAACWDEMVEKEYYYNSGVHINLCPSCNSVFLDKNELEEIKNYVESVDTSSEWLKMLNKAELLWKEIDQKTEETYKKLRQDVDDSYSSDNVLWLNYVVDFIFRKLNT